MLVGLFVEASWIKSSPEPSEVFKPLIAMEVDSSLAVFGATGVDGGEDNVATASAAAAFFAAARVCIAELKGLTKRSRVIKYCGEEKEVVGGCKICSRARPKGEL